MSEPSPVATVVTTEPTTVRSVLPALMAGAVVVAALYFGQQLLVPLVLAGLLAFVLAPVSSLLQRARAPRTLAVLATVLLAFVVLFGIGLFATRQVSELADSLPAYQTTMLGKWRALSAGNGIVAEAVRSIPSVPSGPAGLASMIKLDGSSAVSLAGTVASPVLGILGTVFVVLVFTIFILLSSDDLRDRMVRLVGRRDLHRTILAMNDAARRLSRYFLFQLALNAGFGAVIGAGLWWAGLPNPLLWGLLAALLRFVPYVGTYVALVPPLLLAIAIAPGWSLAIIVLILFAALDLLMGQVIEPLIYGHSTGLSPVAVIISAAFWALLWGPVGLLIATPLTVCLVVVGRHVEALSFLDVMLGDGSPLTPAETFYQRALEGNDRALAHDARQIIAGTSLTSYYDKVALSGLALAQSDLSRDGLAFERLEAIHARIAAVLELVAHSTAAQLGHEAAPGWEADGAVVCIPGRGQLDDLAAGMAVQALRSHGYGARLEANTALGASDELHVDIRQARLCCLSLLEEGSTAAGVRYFILRMQRLMPDAAIVVGLWHAMPDSQLLAALRSEGKEERVVLSLGELVALARALSASD